MSEEALDIIELAWRGDGTVTYEGKYWQIDEALIEPAPLQRPHPPIWAAVHSPRAIDFAAQRGYHMAQNIDTDESMAQKFADWREAWKGYGHEGPMPRQFLMRVVHVAETDELAHEQARTYLLEANTLGREIVSSSRLGFGSNPRGMGHEDSEDIRERGRIFRECARSYDFWLDNGLALVGSPESVARQIAEGREKIGYDHFAGKFHIGRMPHAVVESSLTLFGQEIIPAFK